jgi:hypothetical protein
MNEWEAALGRPWETTDQPPGTYKYKAGRGCPWQPLRILWDGYEWHVLLTGKPVSGSGKKDPMDIPLVKWKAPFHPISLAEYVKMIEQYETAAPGSPLRTPDQPVNLRQAPPL